jgi:hypothetical protein
MLERIFAVTDIQSELDDIKSIFDKSQQEVTRVRDDLDLLQLDLSLQIGDAANGKPKYRMEFAVDYDIIHSFAFTKFKPDELAGNLSNEQFWKKLDEDRLFCFFLLRVFRDKLVLLPPHGWEMENKHRQVVRDYGVIRELFKEDRLPRSLIDLADDEAQNSEVADVLDSCMRGRDICEEKIKVLLEFTKGQFPDIYTALTFDANMGIGTLNSLLSERIVTYQQLLSGLKIDSSEITKHSTGLCDWLQDIRPKNSKNNQQDAIAIAYLYEINNKIKDGHVLLILATDTSILRGLTEKMPIASIRLPGRRRRLPLVRDRSYWNTFLRYFQGQPGEAIGDAHYQATFDLVNQDKTYVDNYITYMKDLDSFVRDQAGHLQKDRIEMVRSTIDIVKGILSRLEDRTNLQMAFSHQWKDYAGKGLLARVNSTIADRAQTLMKVLKVSDVQEALKTEIEGIGHHVTGIALVLTILLKRHTKKTTVKSAIVRYLLHFKDPDIERLKKSFFESNDHRAKGADAILLASMRQDQAVWGAHPEIFVLTAYLLVKNKEPDLALQEISMGLNFAKDRERTMLFLVEAMIFLGLNRFDAAIESCRKGLAIFQEDESLRILLGFSLWSSYRYRAMECSALDEAIAVTAATEKSEDPHTRAIAKSNLVYFHAENGDLASAKGHLRELEKMLPDKDNWPALYKNSEGFVLLRDAQLNIEKTFSERLLVAQKAKVLFEKALMDSTHPQVNNNYDSCQELIRDLRVQDASA